MPERSVTTVVGPRIVNMGGLRGSDSIVADAEHTVSPLPFMRGGGDVRLILNWRREVFDEIRKPQVDEHLGLDRTCALSAVGARPRVENPELPGGVGVRQEALGLDQAPVAIVTLRLRSGVVRRGG